MNTQAAPVAQDDGAPSRPSAERGVVLVTGAAGFFGVHIVRGLLARGHSVVAFDLAPEQTFYDGWMVRRPELTYVRGDVLDFPRLVGTIVGHGVRDVVQAAAFFGIDQDSRLAGKRGAADDIDVTNFLKLNIGVVWQLCELFRNMPSLRRLVAISSRGAYGSYSPDEGLIAEDAALRPVGFYGASKASADLALAAYRKLYGIDAVALRVTGLYGPLLSDSRKEGFIESRARAPVWQFVHAAAAGFPLHLEAGADFVWEFNYVKDAAAAVARVLEAPAVESPVYNVGAGEGYKLSRIADVVNATVPGADIKLGPGNLPDTPLRSVMSAQRIADELKVRPRWSIEDGVRELAQWWLTGDYGLDI